MGGKNKNRDGDRQQGGGQQGGGQKGGGQNNQNLMPEQEFKDKEAKMKKNIEDLEKDPDLANDDIKRKSLNSYKEKLKNFQKNYYDKKKQQEQKGGKPGEGARMYRDASGRYFWLNPDESAKYYKQRNGCKGEMHFKPDPEQTSVFGGSGVVMGTGYCIAADQVPNSDMAIPVPEGLRPKEYGQVQQYQKQGFDRLTQNYPVVDSVGNQLPGTITQIRDTSYLGCGLGSPGASPDILRRGTGACPADLADPGTADMLLRLGYQIVKVYNMRDNHAQMRQYIKVCTPSGSRAIILVDDSALLPSSTSDIGLRLTSPGRETPFSRERMNGAYSCASTTDGVALENSSCLSFMTRGADLKPNRTDTMKIIDRGSIEATVNDEPFALPIIRLCNIVNNPIGANKVIDDTIKIIMCRAFKESAAELGEVNSHMSTIIGACGSADSNFVEAATNILTSLEDMTSIFYLHSRGDGTSQTDLRRQAQLVHEMKDRYALFRKLLQLMTEMKQHRRCFIELSNQVLQIDNALRKDYSNLACVYSTSGGEALR